MIELMSFAQSLEQELQIIEDQMMGLLDASTILEYESNPYSSIVVIGAPYYWGPTDRIQQSLQRQLKQMYSAWFERFNLLLRHIPKNVQENVNDIDKLVNMWIEKEDGFQASLPGSVEAAKSLFMKKISFFHSFVSDIDHEHNPEVILVIDTSALLDVPNFHNYVQIEGINASRVIVPSTVLRELDNLCHAKDEGKQKKAKEARMQIKSLQTQGKLTEGISVECLVIQTLAVEPDFKQTLRWLDSTINDDRIIASSLEVQIKYPSDYVVIVTGDSVLHSKAEMAKLPYCEPPSR